ncbi:hypothetical protein CPB97_002141 [Podila verticillata]|nr:hypothetical protein CPB97_002141 [Podila verticillata]
MSHDKGIITVVGQNEEQDDEDLVALRQLPRFEPLVVPEVPSQFSLASVFGSLSASKYSDVGEQAFNPNTLVDILVQMNSHSKRCAQDIQDYQRLLAVKMKSLDDYTATAVQELSSIHQRAKANSDQLLSVHALEKQARITTSFLHGIVDKLAIISEHLPPEPSNKETSLESYPNLQRYLQQVPQTSSQDTHEPPGHRQQSGSAGRESYIQPSGLALLGHNSNYQHHSIQKSNYRAASPLLASPSSTSTTTSRASALSIPKARASMALASTSMDFLPSHATAMTHATLSSRELSCGNSTQDIPRSRTTENLPETGATTRTSTTTSRLGPFSGTTTSIVSPQSPALPPRASDNLRKLASKSPQPPSTEHFY